jgi:hypothetical protein
MITFDASFSARAELLAVEASRPYSLAFNVDSAQPHRVRRYGLLHTSDARIIAAVSVSSSGSAHRNDIYTATLATPLTPHISQPATDALIFHAD